MKRTIKKLPRFRVEKNTGTIIHGDIEYNRRKTNIGTSRIIKEETNPSLYPLVDHIQKDLGINFEEEDDTFYIVTQDGKLSVFHSTPFEENTFEERLDIERNHSKNNLDYEQFSILNSNQPSISYFTLNPQYFINTFSGIQDYYSNNSFFNGLKRELVDLVKQSNSNNGGVTFNKRLSNFDLESVKDIFHYVYGKFKET